MAGASSRRPIAVVAREIVDGAAAMWSGELRHVAAREGDWDDRRAFIVCALASRELTVYGWMPLGDALPPRPLRGHAGLLRLSVSRDGATLAGVHFGRSEDVLFNWNSAPIVELVTELSDGTVLVTLNGGDRLPPPLRSVRRRTCAISTPLSQLMGLHAERLARRTAAGLVPTVVTSLDAALAMLDRPLARERARRARHGYVTAAELLAQGEKEPVIRAVEAEKRRRRLAAGGDPQAVSSAAADCLAAVGTDVDAPLVRLLDAIEASALDASRLASELAAGGGTAEDVLRHVYEQARGRSGRTPWPSWDAEELRVTLWPAVASPVGVLAAAACVPHAETCERAMQALAAFEARDPSARRVVLEQLASGLDDPP